MKEIVIGTRGSQLALWQTEFIQEQLKRLTDLPLAVRIIKTRGDQIDNVAFDRIDGKGFFTKEIEDALLAGDIDLAVHSLKDLMTTMPRGLRLAAVGFREDCREVILARRGAFDPDRPLGVAEGGVIGSSSVRRQCQIAGLSPDLEIKDLRGNVPTRVNKLRDGLYDAIVLAYAGLRRLGLDLSDLEAKVMACDRFLPAPGQGLLAIQTRDDDEVVTGIVGRLDDPTARIQTQLERGLLARFEGGCQLPLGVYSGVDGQNLHLHAVLGQRRNGRWVGLSRISVTGREAGQLVDDAYAGLTAQGTTGTWSRT